MEEIEAILVSDMCGKEGGVYFYLQCFSIVQWLDNYIITITMTQL